MGSFDVSKTKANDIFAAADSVSVSAGGPGSGRHKDEIAKHITKAQQHEDTGSIVDSKTARAYHEKAANAHYAAAQAFRQISQMLKIFQMTLGICQTIQDIT